MTLKSRVQELLDETGLNASSASEAAGLGRRYVQDILDEAKLSLRSSTAEKLASVLNTSTEYLLFGRGPKHPGQESAAAEILDINSRILDKADRELWLSMGRSLAEKRASSGKDRSD